eukprot:5968466-Pyramimonas_sp.AAC.1
MRADGGVFQNARGWQSLLDEDVGHHWLSPVRATGWAGMWAGPLKMSIPAAGVYLFVSLLRVMVELGAGVDAQNIQGQSALHLAAIMAGG